MRNQPPKGDSIPCDLILVDMRRQPVLACKPSCMGRIGTANPGSNGGPPGGDAAGGWQGVAVMCGEKDFTLTPFGLGLIHDLGNVSVMTHISLNLEWPTPKRIFTDLSFRMCQRT